MASTLWAYARLPFYFSSSIAALAGGGLYYWQKYMMNAFNLVARIANKKAVRSSTHETFHQAHEQKYHAHHNSESTTTRSSHSILRTVNDSALSLSSRTTRLERSL